MRLRQFCLPWAAALLLTACAGATHDTNKEDEHKHDATIAMTAYTTGYEFFVDADPLISGKQGHLIVHVTSLNDFKPVSKGEVTVSLNVSGKQLTKTIPQPEEPGIYIFELTPPAPGSATLSVTVKASAGTQSAVFPGLTVYADEHEAYEAAEAAAPSSPNGIAFPKEQSWTTDFATAETSVREIGSNVRAMALVEPTATGEHTLCATTPGRVTILDKEIAVGQQVGAGKAMFRVNAAGLAEGDLKVRLLEAQAEYDRAGREYARLKGLEADRLTTAAEVTRARAEYETASIALSALRKNFAGGSQTVASPISGYVQSLSVTDGQWVDMGQPLATVASSSMVQLTAKVPARYATELTTLSNAYIMRAGGEPMDIRSLAGRFVSRGKLVEPGSPMLPVVIEIRNELGLLPGSYVETILQFGGGRRAVAIPRSAVVEEMGNTFVMVQITPEYFEKRQVSLGEYDGAYYEVLSGLKEGERIVSKGAPIVKLSQGAGALDAHAGHAH